MTTTEDRNRAITRRLLEELWSGGDLAIADELFASDLLHHDVPPGTAPGPEGQKQFLTTMRGRMPNMCTEIQSLIAERDLVAVRWTRRWDAPDGGMASAEGADILRIIDGRIVELWAYRPQRGIGDRD
jgi:predicted SnoaL-like aldol condensation-catalyzing enzyme